MGGAAVPTMLTGTFDWDPQGRRWCWSDQMFALYGFEPGEVVPTTEVLLAHQDLPSREHLDLALRAGAVVWSGLGALRDAGGVRREVVITLRCPHGPGGAVHGQMCEVTAQVQHRARELADAQIEASWATRGIIEQAKGALGVVLRTDPDVAFEAMREASMRTNVPVRQIATKVLQVLPDLGRDLGPVEQILGERVRRPG